MPVTNPITGLGSSELPFGAVSQAQILTGGFGAEFGRSIGGVVNITTKSGTNKWETGAMYSIEPSSLRGKYKNLYYANTGAAVNAATDGTLKRRDEDNTRKETKMGAYVGGPIIEDKLFMFVSAEQTKRETSGSSTIFTTASDANSIAKWGWTDQTDTFNRYLAKFDWNLSDDHRIEFTAVGDSVKSDMYRSGYNHTTGVRGYTVNSGEHYENDPANTPGVGADFQMLKYVGNLTPNLTLTAMVGRLTSDHSNNYDGYDVFDLKSALPQIISTPANRAPGLTYTNNQPLTGNIMPKGGHDDVRNYRLDLEYKWNAHTIRVGADKVSLDNQNTGFITAGGSTWTYQKQD